MQEIAISENKLRWLYIGEQLSLREISALFQVDLKTTIKLFKKYRIKTRSIADSWKIRRQKAMPDKKLDQIAAEYKNGAAPFRLLARKYGLRRQTLSKYLKMIGINAKEKGFYLLGRKKTKSHRKNISEGRKKMLANSPVLREKLRKHRLTQVLPLKDTLIERLVGEELGNREIGHYSQYPILGVCIADKAFPECKLAIFCDGDYWHRRPGAAQKDERINKLLRDNGWTVLRFWEADILQNPKRVVDLIEVKLKNLRGGTYGIEAPKVE